jgi:DNA-binding beta-propeller fold protein YncE
MDDLLTDHDDPEKRIAALERQHGAAPSRRFEATAAPPSTKQMMKYTYVLMFGAMASLGAIYMALFLIGALVGSEAVMQVGGAVVLFAFLLGVMPAFAAFRRRMNREKAVLVDVGSGGLTVSTKPGDVFSFGDAQLGRWTLEGYGAVTKGTALHLRSGGRDRFVLGGRDHRIANETPLEAPPVDSVDASMSASEFDEFLTMVGGPRRPDVHAPTPGQPTRCLLTPNPARMFSSSIFGMFKNTATALRMNANPPKSSVAIDVGEDAISVIDLTSNARIASAPLEKVTATPAASTRSVPRMGVLTMAVLVVRVPDSEPLTIGCPDWAGPPESTWSGGTKLAYRFAWRGQVPAEDEPAFVISDADWLTLVEKFGLAPRLEDRATQGSAATTPGGAPLARPKRKLWIYAAIFAGVMFIAAPAMMLVAGNISNSHQRQADQLKADREMPFALPFTDLRVPHGVAVDAAGNVYVTDSHTNRVVKLTAGSNTQTVLPFTGLDLCSNNIEAATAGVAVDAAGDVYVSDSCHNRVLKLAAGSSTQTVLPFRGLDFPQGLAVDSAGAVYALDHSGGRILKLAAGSGTQTVLPKAGLAGPTGDVAVDTTGNVYVSCSRGRSTRSCLLRLAPGSDTWTRLPSASDHSGDTFSSGEQTVAVDAAGNVYMIASRVVLKLAPGSDNWTELQGAPPLVDPMGLAVDARGNVYVTDHVGSRATGGGLPWEKDDSQGFVLRLPAG